MAIESMSEWQLSGNTSHIRENDHILYKTNCLVDPESTNVGCFKSNFFVTFLSIL